MTTPTLVSNVNTPTCDWSVFGPHKRYEERLTQTSDTQTVELLARGTKPAWWHAIFFSCIFCPFCLAFMHSIQKKLSCGFRYMEGAVAGTCYFILVLDLGNCSCNSSNS